MLSFISAVRELILVSSEEAPVTFRPIGDAVGGWELFSAGRNTNVRACGEPEERGPPSSPHSWVTGPKRGDDLFRFTQMVRARTQGSWVSGPLYSRGCWLYPHFLVRPTGGLHLTRTFVGRGFSLPSGCFLCPVSS